MGLRWLGLSLMELCLGPWQAEGKKASREAPAPAASEASTEAPELDVVTEASTSIDDESTKDESPSKESALSEPITAPEEEHSARPSELLESASAAPVAPSFAERLRNSGSAGGPLPPAQGFRFAAAKPMPRKRPSCGESGASVGQRASESNDVDGKGWKKEHKASWNTKLQQKVAYQSHKRAEQSRRDRGLDDCN